MDPIADMICSINNAQAVGKKQVIFYPYSDFKYAFLELLKNEGFIDNVEKKGRLSKRKIVVDLKYTEDGKPKITKIRKISKQGQRIYSTYKELKPVKSGYGVSSGFLPSIFFITLGSTYGPFFKLLDILFSLFLNSSFYN
jgi:small subunit ribosomal protein S8